MKTVILAGGLGSRLSEETDLKPKPMVEIGGKPILWHIMNIYAAHGFNEFIVALGYKAEVVKEYFLNFYSLSNDFTVRLASGQVEIQKSQKTDWVIHLVDTGIDTQTGGRLKCLKDWIGNETFMMTYGDGVGNVNLRQLQEYHRSHGKTATVTAVRPPARFGGLVAQGDQVTSFLEKPQTGEGWINGGFFMLEPKALDYIESEKTIWEREPMERLAHDNELNAFWHHGFFQPMDTLREKQLLENLWTSGKAPWKIW